MGIPTTSGGRLRGAAWALALVCASLPLEACAANAYAGIALAPGAAEPDLQALAQQAQFGDKQAQLELGIRYEEGRGVAPDRARAAWLYREAARTTGGTRLLYVPATGNSRGMTVPISSGPEIQGLPQAAERLSRLSAMAGASTPPGGAQTRAGSGSARANPPRPPSTQREALNDLILLDHGFETCAAPTRAMSDGPQIFEAMRTCFRRSALPADCQSYRRSLLKAAALVSRDEAMILLGPVTNQALRTCPRADGDPTPRGVPPAADPPTILDSLLAGAGRVWRMDSRAELYQQWLCAPVLTGELEQIRLSELLVCSDQSLPDSRIRRFQLFIRQRLDSEESR